MSRSFDQATSDDENPIRSLITDLLSDNQMIPVTLGLVALWAFFSSQTDVFLSPRNLSNLMIQSVVLSLIGLAVAFVLLVAEIDLSVASVSGVASVLMAKLIVEFGFSTPVAILAAIAAGMVIGLISGIITLGLFVPSFIVTLGVALILGGFQLRLLPDTGRYNLIDTPIAAISQTTVSGTLAWALFLLFGVGVLLLGYPEYRQQKQSEGSWSGLRALVGPLVLYLVIGGAGLVTLQAHRGVPFSVLVTIIIFGVVHYLLSQTQYGTHIYAIGGNIDAARRAGIDVWRMKLSLFSVTGGLAALAGIMAASRSLAVSQASGGGIGGGALLLQGIAAPVIGGVSLFGGRGTAAGALLGALIIGTVSNGLNLMGIGNELRLIVTGGLLIIAVAIDKTIQRVSQV